MLTDSEGAGLHGPSFASLQWSDHIGSHCNHLGRFAQTSGGGCGASYQTHSTL